MKTKKLSVLECQAQGELDSDVLSMLQRGVTWHMPLLPDRAQTWVQDDAREGRLLSVLSQEPDNFSGSDLYALCAEAASIPLYEESVNLSE